MMNCRIKSVDQMNFYPNPDLARIIFHSNPVMSKAEGTVIELQLEKQMAVKTVDRLFSKDKVLIYSRCNQKSQATRDPYKRRAIGFQVLNQ
jgi:hypothetical protein